MLTIENNLLIEGRKYIVSAERTSSYSFKNNIMVGARNLSDTNVATAEIACYSHYSNVGAANAALTNVTVKDNICQGSQGIGFILPFQKCDDFTATSNDYQNTVGSAKIGYLLTNPTSVPVGNTPAPIVCKTARYLKAYGCEIGITSNPEASGVIWHKLMLADNKRALGLRFGGVVNQRNNSVTITDSWISAVSRPTCEQCYGDQKTSCSNLNALRLLTVTSNYNNAKFDDSIQ